jgi:hypothetical protein
LVTLGNIECQEEGAKRVARLRVLRQSKISNVLGARVLLQAQAAVGQTHVAQVCLLAFSPKAAIASSNKELAETRLTSCLGGNVRAILVRAISTKALNKPGKLLKVFKRSLGTSLLVTFARWPRQISWRCVNTSLKGGWRTHKGKEISGCVLLSVSIGTPRPSKVVSALGQSAETVSVLNPPVTKQHCNLLQQATVSFVGRHVVLDTNAANHTDATVARERNNRGNESTANVDAPIG